jgi:nitrogenase molybdenum-iron protein alpha chain
MDMTLNNPCWGKLTPPWLKPVESEEVEQQAA